MRRINLADILKDIKQKGLKATVEGLKNTTSTTKTKGSIKKRALAEPGKKKSRRKGPIERRALAQPGKKKRKRMGTIARRAHAVERFEKKEEAKARAEARAEAKARAEAEARARIFKEGLEKIKAELEAKFEEENEKSYGASPIWPEEPEKGGGSGGGGGDDDEAYQELKLHELMMNIIEDYDIDPDLVFGDLALLRDILDEIVNKFPKYTELADKVYERYKSINAEANAKFEQNVDDLVDDMAKNPNSNQNQFNQYYSPSITGTTISEYIEAIYRAFKDECITRGIRVIDFRAQLNFLENVEPWKVYQEVNIGGRKHHVFRPAREVADLAMSRCAVVFNVNYTSGRTPRRITNERNRITQNNI